MKCKCGHDVNSVGQCQRTDCDNIVSHKTKKMKAEIKKQVQEKTFEPFDLVITVESKEEAQYIWHLLNQPNCSIKKIVSEESLENCHFPDNTYVNHGTWVVLNSYMESNDFLK